MSGDENEELELRINMISYYKTKKCFQSPTNKVCLYKKVLKRSQFDQEASIKKYSFQLFGQISRSGLSEDFYLPQIISLLFAIFIKGVLIFFVLLYFYIYKLFQIFRYLKNYVWSRRLFDPKHPWICLCHNDKLANVFRCNKFLIHDVP